MYKQRYGTTTVELLKFADRQKDLCAICQRSLKTGERNAIHVDHDHATGAIRGLLCGGCNNGLGQFNDDPNLLVAATNYLTQSRKLP